MFLMFFSSKKYSLSCSPPGSYWPGRQVELLVVNHCHLSACFHSSFSSTISTQFLDHWSANATNQVQLRYDKRKLEMKVNSCRTFASLQTSYQQKLDLYISRMIKYKERDRLLLERKRHFFCSVSLSCQCNCLSAVQSIAFRWFHICVQKFIASVQSWTFCAKPFYSLFV